MDLKKKAFAEAFRVLKPGGYLVVSDMHIHEFAVEDSQGLDCHHPDNPVGPASTHPKFKGCINCHND